jgi:hypothetical protein
MEKTQVTLLFDRAAYREFKAECIRHETTPTQVFQALLGQQLDVWQASRNAQYRKEEVSHA